MITELPKDRLALITGAGSGIGRATARVFAEEGASVGVVDLDAEAAGRVAAEIQAAGGAAVAVQADVADEAAVRRAVDTVAQTFGGLNVVVNNAGIPGGPPTTLDRMAVQRWDHTLAVNLRAQLLVCQAAFPYLSHAGRGSLRASVSFTHPGRGSLRPPRGQSLLRSYLATHSFPPRPPASVLSRARYPPPLLNAWTYSVRAVGPFVAAE